MDEISTQEVEKHRRGPKPQARKKMLISMTAADYDEFSMWADDFYQAASIRLTFWQCRM